MMGECLTIALSAYRATSIEMFAISAAL